MKTEESKDNSWFAKNIIPFCQFPVLSVVTTDSKKSCQSCKSQKSQFPVLSVVTTDSKNPKPRSGDTFVAQDKQQR